MQQKTFQQHFYNEGDLFLKNKILEDQGKELRLMDAEVTGLTSMNNKGGDEK